jgi:peroxiredoxin
LRCNIQLVSYARSYEEFEKRGFRVAGISVDPPSRNTGMVEKLDLSFPRFSDPRGELLKHVGLWNEEEGVSEPAIVVLDQSATGRDLYSGGTASSDASSTASGTPALSRLRFPEHATLQPRHAAAEGVPGY